MNSLNNALQKITLYPNLFSEKECQKIRDWPEGFKPSPVGTLDAYSLMVFDSQIRNSSSCPFLITPENFWVFKRICDTVLEANNQWYHFKIHQIIGTQVLEYKESQYYKFHTDIGTADLSSRKLSVVLFLSHPSDYEGGQLTFSHYAFQTPAQNQGTLVIFPSYMPHTVKPVTKGTRYTLVAWVHGPCFR